MLTGFSIGTVTNHTHDFTTASFVFFVPFVVKQMFLNHEDHEVHEEGEEEYIIIFAEACT